MASPSQQPQGSHLGLRLSTQVLKFVGCYHGHADSFLVQAGSGVATLGLPDSPGVPASSTGAACIRVLLKSQGFHHGPVSFAVPSSSTRAG